MFFATLPLRGIDAWGSGDFASPRGTHKDGTRKTHKGIDFACYPGTIIHSPIAGRITKFGYPYSSDLSFRYVEITDKDLYRHRMFYVKPSRFIKINQLIEMDEIIGEAQDIAGRYSKPTKVMKNHVHYEILINGKPVDPENYS